MTTLQTALAGIGLTWRAAKPHRPLRGDTWNDNDGLWVVTYVYGADDTSPAADGATVLAAVAAVPGWAEATTASVSIAFPGATARGLVVRPAAEGTITPAQLATRPELADAFTSSTAGVARRLLAALNTSGTITKTVHPSPPTMTYGTTRTLTGRVYSPVDPSIRNLGGPVTWSAGSAKATTATSTVGLDMWVVGDAVEFGWVSQTNNAERIWVWVDGQPCTAAPDAPGGGTIPATTAGTTYFGKLAFASVARRRVTIYAGLINAFVSVSTAATAVVSAAPRRCRIGVISDSFGDAPATAGSNPIYSYPAQLGWLLGCEIIQRGVGSTGYTTANGFGDAARVADMAAAAPDALLIVGSVNDGATGLTAACTAAYDAYETALPGIPILVWGPQPTSDTGTITTTRQASNAAVKTAAVAHRAVWEFHDMIGHADTLPSAYAGGTTYNPGDKATSAGSVWAHANGTNTLTGSTPGSNGRWRLDTYALTGTGNAGATTSDGTRDLLLGSDDLHPTAAGMEVLAQYIATDLVETLTARAAA